jgi:stage V sporulation protein R
MDHFVNPLEDKERQREDTRQKKRHAEKTFPAKPQRDVLLYLLKYIPMEQWKQNILSMVRDESIYFRPQMATKVMNEGWASYWDSYMMATRGFAGDDGIFNYAKHHAGVLGGKHNMGNPYKLGVTLFNDIKDRWDKGKHGREWERCEDISRLKNWNTKANKGREKIFEVREFYNDYTFINEFFTRDFCEKNEFFEYNLNPETNQYEITSRDHSAIKAKLLKRHENGGRPVISLENLKYKTGGEILLRHHYEDQPLDSEYVKQTLVMFYKIAHRPVNIKTMDVDITETTQYTSANYNFGQWNAGVRISPAVSKEITETPVIYRYDGARFTRVKNTKNN